MPLRSTAMLATGSTQSHDVAGLDCGTTYLFAVKGRGDGSTYSQTWGTYTYVNKPTSECATSTSTPTPTHTPTVTSSEQIELLDLGGSFPDVFRVRASNLVSSSSYTLRTGVDNNNFALVVACTIRSDAPELSDTTYYIAGYTVYRCGSGSGTLTASLFKDGSATTIATATHPLPGDSTNTPTSTHTPTPTPTHTPTPEPASAWLDPNPYGVNFQADGAWREFTVHSDRELKIVANPTGSEVRVEITSNSSAGNFCPAEPNDRAMRRNSQHVYLAGCALKGDSNDRDGFGAVELRDPSDDSVLRTYTLTIGSPSTPTNTPTPTPDIPPIVPIPTPVPIPDFAEEAQTAVAKWDDETDDVTFCREGTAGCTDTHRVTINVVTPRPVPTPLPDEIPTPTPTFPCNLTSLACVTWQGGYPEIGNQNMWFPQPLHTYRKSGSRYIYQELIWTDDILVYFNNTALYRYLPAVMLHEFGHTPGLGHSSNSSDVMYRGNQTQTDVRSNDREALNANYAGHSPHEH